MNKIFKLWIHQPNFSEEEIVVNPKDFQNGVKEGDIIEIYQVFENGSSTCKLLLQIKSLQTDFQQKETISIKYSVANKFNFRAYWDLHVFKVTEPHNFGLNLVELKFKDQYLSRSDMWRFGRTLVNTSVYTSKKLSFAGARAEVYEMWATGDTARKVTCGVVGEDTRVVFRSGSASVFIFLQMSKEMWDFDINGDLYFEKTVNGFLMELFTKWKEMKCNHAVTIVYFSRIFYENTHLNDYTDTNQSNQKYDYKGRYYEDIYRVIVNQERREDWSTVLVTLKKHFTRYCENIHENKFKNCSLSTASEGNFLEVINLGANVLEKAYIDLNLEGTGRQLVVVTPGAGMFEVDRELAKLTKQKIVDNGLSADLVCMAEQPLHSVPLLKLHSSSYSDALIGDDYTIPHWINHSFYTSRTQLSQRNVFIPRIKVPDFILESHASGENGKINTFSDGSQSDEMENSKLPDFVDYDAYDAQVFTCVQTKPRPQTVTPGYNPYGPRRDSRKASTTKEFEQFLEKDSHLSLPNPFLKSKSSAVLIKKKRDSLDEAVATSFRTVKSLGTMLHFGKDAVDGSGSPLEQHYLASERVVVGSADTSSVYQNVGRPQRALLNPFRPNYLPCKMTCNRNRWKHVFPKGPGGEMLQEHHHRVSETLDDQDLLSSLYPGSFKDDKHNDTSDDIDGGNYGDSDDDSTSDVTMTSPPARVISAQRGSVSSKHLNQLNIKNLGWVLKLHAPSDEDWTAAVKTFMDWKSLTIPGCLPVTTDYFPDARMLNNLYKIHNYDLFIGEEDEEDNDKDSPVVSGEDVEIIMKPDKIFKELISQRIGQGFQLISPDANMLDKAQSHLSPVSHSRRSFGIIPKGEADKDYNFMMGRTFHRITAPCSGQVSVTRYHPTHVIKFDPVRYTYQLWSDSKQEFIHMTTPFMYEDLTNYNWNYLDQYVARDEESLNLIDSLNYWRVRLLLLPLKKPRHRLSTSNDCEDEEDHLQHTYLEGILRFLETVNRIRRPTTSRYQAKKVSTSRRISTPCAPASQLIKNTAARTHRRSKSGEGLKDLPESSSLSPTTSPSPEKPRPGTPVRHGSSSSDHEEQTSIPVPPSLEEIFKAMNNKENGVGILPEMRGLPPGTFLGTDATSWLMKYARLKHRSEAVQLGQQLLAAGYIQHASRSLVQIFIDGFYLYYMIKPTERREVVTPDATTDLYKYRIWKITHDDLLSKFEFKWFEVVMREVRSEDTRLPYGSFIETEDDIARNSGPQSSKLIPVYRDAEINLGQSGISDRSEWCTVRYHGFFCPDNAYEVHLRWLISTGSVINQLVQSWARKVTLYGFHLVPVPSFLLDGKRTRSDPFIEPHFISLEETAFRGNFEKLGFHQGEYEVRVCLLLESILQKFGFIKDFPYDEGIYKSFRKHNSIYPFRYIHYTGAVFVTIVTPVESGDGYGYTWMLNDMITKRWKSSVSLDHEAILQLKQNLQDFCSNKDKKLDTHISLLLQTSGFNINISDSELQSNN